MPTARQLRSALLTAAELGPAFVAGSSGDGDTATSHTGCASLDALTELAGSSVAEVAFAGGDSGPFVSESLRGGSASRLHQRFVAVTTALAACKQVRIPLDSNRFVDLRVGPFDFGRLGDETAGARMDGEIEGTPIVLFLALTRIGAVGMSYMYQDMNNTGSQLAYLFAIKAAEKIRRTVPSA